MPPAPDSLHKELDAAFDAKAAADQASTEASTADEAVKKAQDDAKTKHGAAGDAATKVTTLESQFVNDFKTAIEGGDAVSGQASGQAAS